MKEMMKRITALILCAVLLLGQVAMGAEASDVSSVITESYTHINPLYADQITEQDLVDVAPVVYAFDPADYVTSLEAAGTALREQLKKRELSCTVYIRVNSYTDKLHETVFSEAIKHTGNPTEGDYLKWVYAGYKGKVSVIDSNGYSYVTFTYNMTYYTSAQQEATMDAAVTKLLNDLNLYSASDYNKVRGIYDYICANIVYDYDNLNDSNYTLKHTAYAALINKKAVCQGYALLFYRLSLSLGVDCRLVSGIGNGGPHGWNIVKLGDLYYCLDSTWDAVRNPYEFFLKCEANFGDHHPEDDWAKLGYNISKTDYNPSSDEPNTSHKHEMGDWSIGTNATCTTDGFKIRYCKKSGCDYSETDPIVAAGHSWVAATCTVPKTCSVCDATDGTTIPHVYDQEIVDPKYLVSEATTTSLAVYRKSCKCGAAGEETFTAGELKPSVGDDKLPQLGSATNLTWGTEHGWNWDNNDIPYHDPSYDIALPGVASFKRASLDQGYYEIALYKVGQKDAIAHSSWQNDGYSTEWIDKYFVHHINESGDYYFTVTALGDGTNYADGPTVVSDTWHYVKPAKALKTATQLGWDWPEATFNVADNKSKVFGASVKIYYTDDLNVEPEWEGTSTYFYYTDRIDVEWLASDSGNGYYSFQVMLLSSDLNTTANSGWSAMSPTYKLGAGGNDCSTLGHNWQDATCTTPKTCSVCGITSGSALGHDWNAATCTDPKTCSVCGTTSGSALGHNWNSTNCTEPKTCKVCGVTDGSAAGHDWNAATCTDPKTCSVCGTTSGSALGHDWNAATCTTPKTCKTCGMTDGTTIPHVYDQEVADPKYLVKEATQTEQAIYWKSCVCGKAGTETFKHGNLKPQDFKDVPKNAYYYDGVMWAVEHGVTTGTGAGTFSPDAICSRAQVVTFLWRAAGEPEPKSSVNPFKDVKSYDYFYKAVLWALEKGITTGTGDGTTFEPNKNCNRGQIVTFLCRAKNGVPYSNQNPFVDVSASSFFYNPVLWAVQNGITTGTGDGTTFAPNADCTRGQVITFLYRAYK